MLDIRVNGSSQTVAEVIRSVRDVPARVIPYAASTAMTRVAKLVATKEMPDAMRKAFEGPTRWTLNSLRINASTRESLSARVFVKDDAPKSGTRPEDYLLPQVQGGGRKEKRFERAMRYAGLLPAGWRAIPGQGAPLDSNGNFTPGEIQRILTATRSAFDMAQNKTSSSRSRRNAKNAPYFGITPSAGAFTRQGAGLRTVYRPSSLTPGVYKRFGRSIKPVLIFTQRQPQYRPRLDFAGVAEMTTLKNFGPEFNRAAAAILSRPR